MHRFAFLAVLAALPASAAGWVQLFNGKDLSGWTVVGESVWTAMRDGTLLGQRDLLPALQRQPFMNDPSSYRAWLYRQSWLYTDREFTNFDLHVEYWLKLRGNGGISIRDTSRAAHAVTSPPDFTRTPSKIGYEIQISNQYPDQYPTGSIYTFVKAKTGLQVDNDWNSMDIESRPDVIRVKINSQLAAEHPGDPKRSKSGPIGLQLHDQFSVMMFRNIRIREIVK
ncbi:MAG: DUF1080 domain-containing protein [Bryobacteraceae bacterium]